MRWSKNTQSKNHLSSSNMHYLSLLWGKHWIKMPIRIYYKAKEPPEPLQHAQYLAKLSKCYYSFHNITGTPQRTKRIHSEHLVISQIGHTSKIWNEMEYTPYSRSRKFQISSLYVAKDKTRICSIVYKKFNQTVGKYKARKIFYSSLKWNFLKFFCNFGWL